MIVFHGSNQIVKNPDLFHSFKNLDFGKGFYVTSVREQAERWARRKADFESGTNPILNIYELSDVLSDYKVLDFKDELDSWIDFVCDCRDGKDDYKNYDLIIGKVANDKVFRVVDMYHSGIWDKSRAIKEIRAYQIYNQIAFVSEKSLNLISFKSSEVIK